ncbi:uncharacterized protein FOMMEDRAFT_144833 [Fomitiporia mediterranea MF3/22]|uniref:uncharacterized protein n=1 Tax=Fomitiporia mediterranea (strain MF3/22) TaxID=694068 RepID=UPI000440804B|nr:uncharacterized protein FOMMEDRAFT_144833 [Fomitiporia mediterranea MF3/22]EJD07043.1 hypothetical protein FOMMEDRAFT_144833 [Fomitiporia mediterranea MF3/22]
MSFAVGSGYSRASTSVPAASPTPKRPASIQELAQRAEINWDASKDFKFWLKVAERARHAGQVHDLHGDLENAFVEYARAATLILNKIPTHRDCHTRLDQIQRDTLIMKGKGVLDRMGLLKPPLIDWHNTWENAQSRGSVPPRSSAPPRAFNADRIQRDRTPSRKSSINEHYREERDSRQIWYPDTAPERRRREESLPRSSGARSQQQTRVEEEGILRRQREAEEEARAVRRALHNSAASGFVSIPIAPQMAPQRSTGHSSTRSASDSILDTPPFIAVGKSNEAVRW